MKRVELSNIDFDKWNAYLDQFGGVSLMISEKECSQFQKIQHYIDRAHEGRELVLRIGYGFYLGLFHPKVMLLSSFVFSETLKCELSFTTEAEQVELVLRRGAT
ncbi:hypothetical protein [Thaumasiovibrio subtropicus]|uniref:hypothetical protein n=1 Tax=Thaumasiovibrio subtropicus TaxID=1891207 RepID=UPI000B34D524|nr:hypothetical protein [Thaumasiovibrio subtropicus]